MMEKLAKTFISMVYPLLISFFIFCFVDAFVTYDLEALQIIAILFMILFGILFIIGFILTIVCVFKERKNSNK